ncbi:hypothetical protein [Kordiimonas sp.]|uniref:hypothetical protein n=1 Tax=Kordiimonas sp. TaxID=1970157 RepID=UPI003A91629C
MFIEHNQTKKLFGSDNTLGLFVALYLILLAFFIVLTSASQHAASRAAAAMESVNTTFQPEAPNKRLDIDPRASEDASNDPVLQNFQRAFFAEFNIEGRFSNQGGNTFEVQFPENYLFPAGSFRVRPDMHPFLNQLVAGLNQTGSGRQELAILFGVGAGPVDAEMTRPQEVAVRRAGSLARYLLENGVEEGTFTTGFAAVPEGEVLAVFRSIPSSGTVAPLGGYR